MKKTFLTKRNALLSSAGISWGTGALAFAILVLLARLLAPNIFWSVFSPALKASNALAEKSHFIIAGFSNTAELTIRNEALVSENAALASENAALLKQAESVSALSRGASIVAAVSARPPESSYDTLIVAAGSEEGVTDGMEAFGPPAGGAGVPLGVVSAVMSHYSRVTLFSAPRMSTSGWVGHSNIPVTILGGGGGAMSASVSRSAPIAAGDTVYAPGPGMLSIGSVLRVDSDPSSPSVTLRIQPAQNLFSLGWIELRDVGAVPTRALSSATSTLL
jgi:cell shape-determining protein MreC